jgi:hypothetical protein
VSYWICFKVPIIVLSINKEKSMNSKTLKNLAAMSEEDLLVLQTAVLKEIKRRKELPDSSADGSDDQAVILPLASEMAPSTTLPPPPRPRRAA